jgi:phosphatidylglycerol:prolipoprotein diacylglycerol transferase
MIYHHNLNPAIFKLGPLEPRWYAVMYLVGFAVSYFMIARNPKSKAVGLTQDDIMDWLTYGFFGVMLGGRLGYVLFYNLQMYLQNPLDILAIWKGGMSFHGGMLGVILASYLYFRKKKLPVATMWDIVALPVPLALMFGRLGNFINGELWGKPTDGSWGVVFANSGGGDMPRHPTQLYEAFLEGILLFAILWGANKFLKLKPGSLGGLFLLLYGLGRSVVEFYRLPDAHIGYLYGGWLTMGHMLCLPMILGGLGLLVYFNRPGAPTAADTTANPAPAET